MNNLKIILATMVKDEDDIVEHWINYHGKIFGYENLYIVDNKSIDDTFKICKKYREKGIHLFQEEDYKKKGNIMTQIMNNINCDIFFPIDIDEFIVVNPKANKINYNVKKYLKKIIKKSNDCTFFKCDYIIPKKTNNSDNILSKFTAGSLNTSYGNHRKTFIYKKNLNKDFLIDHGNHMPNVKYELTKICLVHYHKRSHKQMLKKMMNNVKGLGHKLDVEYIKKISNEPNDGFHHIKNLNKFFNGDIQSFEPKLTKHKENDINLIPLIKHSLGSEMLNKLIKVNKILK